MHAETRCFRVPSGSSFQVPTNAEQQEAVGAASYIDVGIKYIGASRIRSFSDSIRRPNRT